MVVLYLAFVCVFVCVCAQNSILFSIQYVIQSVQFSSVAQLCPTLCDPMNPSTPGLPVHHQLQESTQTHVHWVGDAIFCRLLLLLPSTFTSIRVLSNESALHIRWPKYWSFSFNISPSNEHLGLISFRMDWLDLLAVKGLSKVFSNTTAQNHQFFMAVHINQSQSLNSTPPHPASTCPFSTSVSLFLPWK